MTCSVPTRDGCRPNSWMALPMGISFYTFQSMSYTIDVYRGGLAPIRHFVPVLPVHQLLPAAGGRADRPGGGVPAADAAAAPLRLGVFYEGAWLIISGFFLKMVCADNLAVYVDEHWSRGSGGRDRRAASRSGWR